MQVRPVQQLVALAPVQDAPKGLHVDVPPPPPPAPPPHFSFIPSVGSGVHAWPLQH